jgi:hypothetical protein
MARVLQTLHDDIERDPAGFEPLRRAPSDLALEHIGSCVFRVHGLPAGQTALIAGADSRGWRVLRTRPGYADEDWTGCYATLQDALDALD